MLFVAVPGCGFATQPEQSEQDIKGKTSNRRFSREITSIGVLIVVTWSLPGNLWFAPGSDRIKIPAL